MVTCDYCQKETKLVAGATVYPHIPSLHEKLFYLCSPCGAYVGVHRGTEKPLGRLANVELRKAKQKAHAAFDPLWLDINGGMTRSEAYSWLAHRMEIPIRLCHIGMFDLEQCKRVVAICELKEVLEKGDLF